MRTRHPKTKDSRDYIGIDNGVTGSVGIISVSTTKRTTEFHSIPVFKQQNYTKKKGNISRVNVHDLRDILVLRSNPVVLLERPMVNPTRFKSTTSALRALEATLIALDLLELPVIYIDSKEWQKKLLPGGVSGSAELKKASMDVGLRMFPEHSRLIKKRKEADGLLIAEYARRTY